MAEYIDRHALKNDGHLCWHDDKGNTFYEIDHAPIADVVEVVRCKDCKHSTERQGFENHMWNDDCVMCDHIAPSDRIPMNKNDYCSYGERKCDND